MKQRINKICLECAKLGNSCKGTTVQAWTDCIYKAKKEETRKGNEQ